MSLALVIQHPKHVRRIIQSGSIKFIHINFINDMIFRGGGGGILNKKFAISFSLKLLSEKLLILRKIQGDIIYVQKSSRKVPVTLVRFELNLNFLSRFSKHTQISILVKILSVGAHCSIRTDRLDQANTSVSQFLEHV